MTLLSSRNLDKDLAGLDKKASNRRSTRISNCWNLRPLSASFSLSSCWRFSLADPPGQLKSSIVHSETLKTKSCQCHSNSRRIRRTSVQKSKSAVPQTGAVIAPSGVNHYPSIMSTHFALFLWRPTSFSDLLGDASEVWRIPALLAKTRSSSIFPFRRP